MNRMRPPATAILQLPQLNRPPWHIRQHAILDLIESHPIDLPLPICPVELKVMIDRRPRRRREVHQRQARRDHTVIHHGPSTDHKPHDLIRMQIVVILADILIVPERDILPCKGRKVKHNFIPLSHRNPQVVRRDRPRQQPGVRRNDLEGNLCGGPRLPLEIQPEGARDGCVEEAEAVFARLHVEEGPGLAVDVDDVAVEGVGFARGGEEFSVGLVLLGGEDERDVEGAVARGQAEGVFGGVVDDVAAGLAEVGVFGGLGGG